MIPDAGWFWDHAEMRHLIAHDYLFANYVHPSGKHYPLTFRRFRKKETCSAAQDPFRSHTDLCIELIDWAVAEGIPGDFTFDSYFTNAEILNHLHGSGRAYVGDLKANRKISVNGQERILSDWIATDLGPVCRRKITVAGTTQWYFTKSIRLPALTHPVRIVVLWAEERAAKPRKILITNRTYWEVHRVLKTYRKRWTGTETFHLSGKQHLGMGECQLRDGVGQTLSLASGRPGVHRPHASVAARPCAAPGLTCAFRPSAKPVGRSSAKRSAKRSNGLSTEPVKG